MSSLFTRHHSELCSQAPIFKLLSLCSSSASSQDNGNCGRKLRLQTNNLMPLGAALPATWSALHPCLPMWQTFHVNATCNRPHGARNAKNNNWRASKMNPKRKENVSQRAENKMWVLFLWISVQRSSSAATLRNSLQGSLLDTSPVNINSQVNFNGRCI